MDHKHSIQLFRDFGATGIARGGGLSFHNFRATLRSSSSNSFHSSSSSSMSSLREERIRTASRASKRRMRQLQSSMDNAFPMNALGQTPHMVFPNHSLASSQSLQSLQSLQSSTRNNNANNNRTNNLAGINMNMSMESGWSVVAPSPIQGEQYDGMIMMGGLDGNGVGSGGSALPSVMFDSSTNQSNRFLNGGMNTVQGGLERNESKLFDNIENNENSLLPFIRLAAASARASNAAAVAKEEEEEEDRRRRKGNGQQNDGQNDGQNDNQNDDQQEEDEYSDDANSDIDPNAVNLASTARRHVLY